jgi:hypothetical protein
MSTISTFTRRHCDGAIGCAPRDKRARDRLCVTAIRTLQRFFSEAMILRMTRAGSAGSKMPWSAAVIFIREPHLARIASRNLRTSPAAPTMSAYAETAGASAATAPRRSQRRSWTLRS